MASVYKQKQRNSIHPGLYSTDGALHEPQQPNNFSTLKQFQNIYLLGVSF